MISYDTARSSPASCGLFSPCLPFLQMVKTHFLDQMVQVPTVMKDGPRQSSTKKSMVQQAVRNGPNMHVIIHTNPPMNRPVGQSRSISTVGSITPVEEHGRYQRSVRLHLWRVTVDRQSSISDRDNFVIDWTDYTCENFYEMSCVHFTKLLGLPWHYLLKFQDLGILRRILRNRDLLPEQIGFCDRHQDEPQSHGKKFVWSHTIRSVEDETQNAELNGNRNPECWGDFSQLVQIEKIKYLGISQYKVELKFWLDLNSEVSRGTNSKWDFCWIWICSWLKSSHHSGFRLPFNSAFRVSSSTEWTVCSHVLEDSNSTKGKNTDTQDRWIIRIANKIIVKFTCTDPRIVSTKKAVVGTFTLQLLITLFL